MNMVMSNLVENNNNINEVRLVNPWEIIALACHYQQEIDLFDSHGMHKQADEADWKLTALQELVGLMLYNDPTYYTWGPGNEELLRNIGAE